MVQSIPWSTGPLAPILEVKVDDIPIRPLLSLSLTLRSLHIRVVYSPTPTLVLFSSLSSLDSSPGVLTVPHQMQRRLSSFS